MPEPFGVLQIGFGAIGKPVAQAIFERSNLKLVGVVDADPTLLNQHAEELLSMNIGSHTPIKGEVKEAIDGLGDRVADAALIATSSSLKRVAPLISQCLKAGMDVVSLCEELSYPFKRYPELSKKLNQVAHETGRTILGTGINPGFLMDLLPIVLSAPCKKVDSIKVTRCINSSRRRVAFQNKIGTGMTKEQFNAAIADESITGHVGLVESIQLVDDALKLTLDEFEEFPPEAVISTSKVSTPFAIVKKGDVLGLKSKAEGRRKGEVLVKLDFMAYAEATPEFDEVIIEGVPNIQQRIQGGVQGDYGTVGMILNMIPLVVSAPPGLMTMKDMPSPRNTQRYWKMTEKMR